MHDSVSVVIGSKNEERRIAVCLESVISATKDVLLEEIVLVDSSSTDKTVEISRKYPIRILIMSQPDSCPAGRNLGYKHTSGDFVLFIDGNRELDHNGFSEAFALIKENSDVGAVSGQIISDLETDCRSKLGRFLQARMKSFFDGLRVGEVTTLGGPVLIFRRKAMEDAGGTWHPFIIAGGEEAELSYRITEKGYKLVRLPRPIARQIIRHTSILNYLRKYEWKYSVGVGNSLRFTMRTNPTLFKRRLRDSLFSLSLTLFAFYSAISLLLIPFGYLIPFLLALIGHAVILIRGLARGKGGLASILYAVTLHSRIISGLATFAGFMKRIPGPDEFHPEYSVAK